MTRRVAIPNIATWEDLSALMNQISCDIVTLKKRKGHHKLDVFALEQVREELQWLRVKLVAIRDNIEEESLLQDMVPGDDPIIHERPVDWELLPLNFYRCAALIPQTEVELSICEKQAEDLHNDRERVRNDILPNTEAYWNRKRDVAALLKPKRQSAV